jgi:hypothetical protein
MLCRRVFFTVTILPTTEIAASFGLNEAELYQDALTSFLNEKKRQILQLRLETFARYGVDSEAALEAKITQGSVAEHPAWEDLITLENLTARLEELDAHLVQLHEAANHRSF